MNYDPNNPYGQPYTPYPVQPRRPGGTIAPSILSFIFSLVHIPLLIVGFFWLYAGVEPGYYIIALALFLCGLSVLLGVIGLIIGIVKARAGAIVFAIIGLLIAAFAVFCYAEVFEEVSAVLESMMYRF